MKLLLTFLFFLITYSNAASALKIYVFNLESSDSQLIVFPSGYSILIDAGEPSGDVSESEYNAKYVAKRLYEILGKKHIDVFVLSHFHVDHSGSYKTGGIWHLIETEKFTIGKFIRRNVGDFSGSKLTDCDKDTMNWKVIGDYSNYYVKFICYATATGASVTRLSVKGEVAQICSKTQIAPPDEGASVQIIVRDAEGLRDANGNLINRVSTYDAHPVDDNVFSIALRITYGDFVYVTSGDLSGKEQSFQDADWVYHDVETYVAPMMGEVDAVHVNHHGSYYCSNFKWCNTLKPSVAIVSRSSGMGLPQPSTMKNYNSVGSYMYTTGKASAEAPYKTVVKMGDDVIITVEPNAKKFTVSNPSGSVMNAFSIKKNKQPPVACHSLADS